LLVSFASTLKHQRKVKYLFATLFFVVYLHAPCFSQTNPDAIVGKWLSAEGNLAVEVFKHQDSFCARVLWFDDTDDKAHPMEERLDTRNPDKALRTRKIIGIQVLEGLVFNEKGKRWEHGRVYDSRFR
jgi:hypothetical protein